MISSFVRGNDAGCFPRRRVIQKFNFLDLVATLVALSLIGLVVYYVYQQCSGFPDYQGYDSYIRKGTALDRFGREPVSAYLMHLIGTLGMGGREYYAISTASLCIVAWIIALPLSMYKRSLFFIFLLTCPITFILFQTPRFCFSMAFGLLALFGPVRLIFFAIIVCALSHTVMGALAIFFMLVRYVSIKYYFFFILSAILLFIMIGNNWVLPAYSSYFSDDSQRGVGRVAIFVLISIYGIFFSKLSSRNRMFVAQSIILCLSLYMMTPFAHRVTTFVTFLIVYEVIARQIKYINKLSLAGICLALGGVTVEMLVNGKYNYG